MNTYKYDGKGNVFVIPIINMFDFDGVISIGINPEPKDVIITGRSFEEASIVYKELRSRNLENAVYFNPIRLKDRGTGTEAARRCSGVHKATIIQLLKDNEVVLGHFFEDDSIQKEEILKMHPELTVVHVKSKLVEK